MVAFVDAILIFSMESYHLWGPNLGFLETLQEELDEVFRKHVTLPIGLRMWDEEIFSNCKMVASMDAIFNFTMESYGIERKEVLAGLDEIF
jgi:hypothetical protein